QGKWDSALWPPEKFSPMMVSMAPAAIPLANEAAFTTAVASGTAAPALITSRTDGALSTESTNWLAAPSPGVQWKLAWPCESVTASVGAAVPPVEGAAAMRAPGY